MSTINRVPAGVPAGGQFTEGRRSEGDGLGLSRRVANVLHDTNGDAEAIASTSVSADGTVEHFDDQGNLHNPSGPAVIHTDGEYGYFRHGQEYDPTSQQSSSDQHVQPGSSYDPATDSWDVADAQIQNGAVADRVMSDGTMFHRVRPGVGVGTPYRMRFQAHRPLSDRDMMRMSQLVGYTYACTVRGERMGTPKRDSPYSFILEADTTKSSSDDLGMALQQFESDLPRFLAEGSPVRKTNRSGPGTAGTRLVEGMENPPTFDMYYDDVFEQD